MISDIGTITLSGAVLVSAMAVLASIAAIRFNSDRWLKTARWLIGGIALLFSAASIAMIYAFLTDQFQIQYVTNYSEKAMPWGYKIAAFWAGQDGSLLLWAWLLGVLCVVALIGYRKQKGTEHAICVATLAIVCGFFAILLVFAADPFQLVAGEIPLDGHGLNPMLQDPGMIIHPPLLFLGYAGYTIPFAVLVGVLITGRTDNHWLATIRRWLLFSWLFLTAGIILGAWWAYVELGWGGYWAWDPVENASLLPWLTSTALIHSIMVQQHRGMFKIWNAFLIAATFILCIFGTYLTRSGVIESVHAFGESLLGTMFLIFLIIVTSFSIVLILARLKTLKSEHQLEGLISREGAFLLGNVLLVIMTATTLIGTTFPLISGLFMNEGITVGQSFYNKIVSPMGLALAAVMAFGPVLAFGKAAAMKIARALLIPGIATAIVTLLVAVVISTNPWALICTAICTLGTFAVIVDFARSTGARRKSTGENLLVAAIRLIDKDHRRYGGQLAHLGVMMLVIGVAGSSLFNSEKTFQLEPGETVSLDGYELTFTRLEEKRIDNFIAVEAMVTLTEPSGRVFILRPQRRFYDSWQDQPNSEVAVRSTWKQDIYISLAGWEDGGQLTAIQMKINPLIMWIWIGGIVMSLGCFFSMLPRLLPQAVRLHVTQHRKIASAPTQAEAVMQPSALKTETTS